MKLITQTDDLNTAIAILRQSQFVTVDTEFIRETTFWPELCLIQISSDELSVLIDPLSENIDLSSFFTLISDTQVVKVFHSARQDIEIIYKMAGLIPTPLFDTQIAAAICGYGETISYDQIVNRITGDTIDKTSRFTDWSARPLSENQLSYALADVTYLRQVYRVLNEELEKKGRSDWLNEEMSVLKTPKTYDLPEDEAWKKVKGRLRKSRELAVLQKIAAWREREAKMRNIPRGRVLKDEALIEIATQQPKDEASLAKLRTITKGWERSSSAHSLLEAVNEGMLTDTAQLPQIIKHVPLSESVAAAIDLLRVLLKIIAEENKIAARIIATSDDIEKIAKHQKYSTISAMQGWRYEMFGKKAEDMLAGRIGFYFDDGKIALKHFNNE
ncbi:ribonuclease D [Bartonella tamiae]|uniref:Ribonuclease D n=1 Tax=Bartonella tamiae Th239 TaxID=1094558 RepID=J1JUP7_9HYPH|nr:ribonuclease D [Bartonella tamiae]EJF88682.1 ribonuclease D [Bartonella tamiae Th239]EJF95068.1 ribonuclease D [Bartonella tamiae Th307]